MRPIEVGADRPACGGWDTVGPACIAGDGGEPARGRIHPGAWPGVDVDIGEMTGVEVTIVATSCVEFGEEPASDAETVAVVVASVEIEAVGKSRVEARAGATACIESSGVEARAAGFARA